jgi:methyl-accepting chemotaxis protein
MSIIPSLSLFYMGAMLWFKAESLSSTAQIFIFVSTTIIAVSGLLILLKFPKNIIKLRQYIEGIASGVLPDTIYLLNTHRSDDLKFIECGLNAILEEMRHRMELAEQKLDVERALRETIEGQHQDLLKAERHRAMVQSLGAACHHIGQPATILKLRLNLIRQIAGSADELAEIEECEKDLRLIMIVLEKLRGVSEFRTESYVSDEDCGDCEILAI